MELVVVGSVYIEDNSWLYHYFYIPAFLSTCSCSEDDDDIIWDDELPETSGEGAGIPVSYHQQPAVQNSQANVDSYSADTSVLQLHAEDEECFSDTDLLIEQTDSLMQ